MLVAACSMMDMLTHNTNKETTAGQNYGERVSRVSMEEQHRHTFTYVPVLHDHTERGRPEFRTTKRSRDDDGRQRRREPLAGALYMIWEIF